LVCKVINYLLLDFGLMRLCGGFHSELLRQDQGKS